MKSYQSPTQRKIREHGKKADQKLHELEKAYTAAKQAYREQGRKLRHTDGRDRGPQAKSYQAARKAWQQAGKNLKQHKLNVLKKIKITKTQAERIDADRKHLRTRKKDGSEYKLSMADRRKISRGVDRAKSSPHAKDGRFATYPNKFDYPGLDTDKKMNKHKTKKSKKRKK